MSAVVSGFTPLIATALYASVGWVGPAVLMAGYGLLGLLATFATRETWGAAEREDVAVIERTARNTTAPGQHPTAHAPIPSQADGSTTDSSSRSTSSH